MRGDRSGKILEILSKENQCEVADLAQRLGVSQVTMRKDLDSLEARGLIVRQHGFATISNADSIAGRLAIHYEQKKLIAQKASLLVEDGDTIMIESGSCCALLAYTLASQERGINIVTNSAFIADYIRGLRGAQSVLLGGLYQNHSQCLVGPMVREGAGNYHVSRLFIGTDGWTERTGFTNKDQLRAQAVRDMAASADEVVVLTESEKFGVAGIVPMGLIGHRPLQVVTDSRLPEQFREQMTELGIKVTTV